MYNLPFEATIHLTDELVAFPAATAQSETQVHVFLRILAPYYHLSGTALDRTRFLYISFYFIKTSSRLPILPFSSFPVVQSKLQLRHPLDTRTFLH